MTLPLVIAGFLLAFVLAIAMRRTPYACPPNKRILLTMKRHDDTLPAVALLAAARIETEMVQETRRPFMQEVAYRFLVGASGEVPGPWYVVVSDEDLSRAEDVLATTLNGK
jgi:hypothetical protein